MNKINLNLQANQDAWLPRLRVKKKTGLELWVWKPSIQQQGNADWMGRSKSGCGRSVEKGKQEGK